MLVSLSKVSLWEPQEEKAGPIKSLRTSNRLTVLTPSKLSASHALVMMVLDFGSSIVILTTVVYRL